jgi:RimJ/RimL family protein N-acetyltransferase
MTGKENIVLESRTDPRVRLRPVGPGDLEDLRLWKNANSRWFFFKDEITPAMQKEWYAAYLKRPDDVMFIVEHGGKKAGTMGYRILEKVRADAYNIIAAPGARGKGLMKAAMRLMCDHIAATRTKDIGCLVLKGNPAAAYYETCGFRKTAGDEIHDVFTLENHP